MKKLVGEGKPFHSTVDKTAALLKRKVGTGAEFMKELMGVSGVKPTEFQERGLTEIMGMPKMTHEQFMAALASKPAPKIREKVFANKLLRNPGSEPDPHHEGYTLPGGDNYREMLIKAPKGVDNQEKIMELDAKIRHTPMFNSTPQQQADIAKYYNQIKELKAQEAASPKPFQGVPHHFGGEPGILASMRLKDRTGPNGEKLLHLEELQSDWHQQGREKGYKSMPDTNGWTVRSIDEDDPSKVAVYNQFGNEIWNGTNRMGTDRQIIENVANSLQKDRVPDAPFKKNWEEVALKRLIHHAAEKGYHGVVVTPGQEQADRYSLAKHVDEISHNPRTNMATGEKSKSVRIDMKSGSPVQLGVANSGVIDNVNNPDHTNLIGKHLADVVGKDLAKNIMSEERGILSPQDLTLGGEGMKAFYDTKVPNILNSIGKKYGVKVGKTAISTPKDDPWGIEEAADFHGMNGRQYLDHPNRPQLEQQFLQDRNKHTTPVHHFPITEKMRKDVLTNGLPLYSTGGTVHMADGGDMDQMQMAVMDKKIKKPKKPPTPLHFDPAPALKKADIEAHAERITRQMAGLENPNKKTLQQLAREQGLQVDIKSGGKKANLPVIDYSKLGKNAFTVGVPGDPSIGGIVPSKNMKRRHDMQYPKAGEYLRGVGGVPLENEVPMYGGYMYGGYGHPAGWASDLGASAGMFNVVKKLAEEDPTRDIYGHYHKMTPESLNHAVHIMDAVLMHHRPHREPPEKIELLNHLMRNVQLTKSDKDRPYPSFPGFENVADVMLHGSVDSDMRKKIINLLSTEKYMPGGKQKMDDLIYASSHPELRNIETGAGGSGILKFDPSGDLKASLSRHPTYGHDIPSSLIGKTRYTTPFQILAPRSHYRATQEIKAMGKKVDPFNMAKMSIIREPIDEQYINQMGEYENAMRKRLGYKKGGVIKKADGGQVDVTSIGVNEAPNMDVKAFFPPRPATSGVLPVGGIQQAPMQPQQPQPPQPMPSGQPPLQPNQPGQQLRQPPSNILQMTPQGQAMSAIKPPQMARGGQVDRDTMMLALMNRNKKVKYG